MSIVPSTLKEAIDINGYAVVVMKAKYFIGPNTKPKNQINFFIRIYFIKSNTIKVLRIIEKSSEVVDIKALDQTEFNKASQDVADGKPLLGDDSSFLKPWNVHYGKTELTNDFVPEKIIMRLRKSSYKLDFAL